jgi:hypothetical protein
METPNRSEIKMLIEMLLKEIIGNRIVVTAPRSIHNERHVSLERRNSDAPRMAAEAIPT